MITINAILKIFGYRIERKRVSDIEMMDAFKKKYKRKL